MRAVFALNPEALRRLVAKGTVADPLVQEAYHNGKMIVTSGLTNAFVMEELTGRQMDEKWRFGVGVITESGLGVTTISERITPVCFEKGKVIDVPWNEYLPELRSQDVIIKGCNAFDLDNRAGVLLGGTSGGTVGLIMGSVAAQGINLVIAVTHDKLIPSVPEAARWLGIDRLDLSMGMKVGLGIIENANLVTEIIAIKNLFGLKAAVVAGGGYNGAQGSIVIAAEGEETQMMRLWELVTKIHGESLILDVKTEK